MGTGRRRAASIAGWLAVAWALLVPLIGSIGVDYSHRAQYISELGAQGAPHGGVVSLLGFGINGLLVFAFLALAWPFLSTSRVAATGLVLFAGVGVAYLIAAFFRCDAGCPSEGSLSQTLHSYSGLFEYVGSLVGLPLVAVAFWRASGWRGAAVPTLGSALLVGIGFYGMLQPTLQEQRGLYQRIAELGIFAWIAMVGFLLARRSSATVSVPVRASRHA